MCLPEYTLFTHLFHVFLHNFIICWICALYVLFLVPKSGLSLICATGLSWRGEALGNLAGHCALKGCQDFDKIWLFSFLSKSCADLEKGNGKLQGLLVEWGPVAKKDQSWGEISLKQNPKLWKNIRSLCLGLFNQDNGHQKKLPWEKSSSFYFE